MYRKIILIVLLLGAVFANSNQKVILITGTAHGIGTVSYTHLRAPRDATLSRMPSSA